MNARLSSCSAVLGQMPDQVSTFAVASKLASVGVPVFPVWSDSKRPVTRHGFHDASTDIEQIEAWWSSTPDASLAIPTGQASGVVVVDVDVHGRVNGYEAATRTKQAGLLSGWELIVRTPSGGMHLYYPATDAAEQRSWQSANSGIDFRGDGGYIIIPPSARMTGNRLERYTVERVNHGFTSNLDHDRLREFLDPKTDLPRRAPTGDRGMDVDRLAAWVSRLQEGERNHGLFWAACKMAENNIPSDTALDALAAAGGSAGLAEREILTTVRSAYRTVHGAPAREPSSSALSSTDRPPPTSTRAQVLS
ncbi:MAG: bifunctional DNA primase/polymerase [Leucobacter sp.]